ncbi:YdaS family helix-turn-helix protein [Massilia sp. TSP1-1-2]|uniref:YdaS family helix-turn-helix protein n=1 Tax=Massilia sp. TSP1-1-2 TaxID=2804649 RepID=UPI003CF8E8F5
MLESGIAKAVRLAESQSALARLIKCTPQCVQRWVTRGWPSPAGSQKIEAALQGRVTRAELNPVFAPMTFA